MNKISKRLLLVSNRLPVTVEKKRCEIRYKESVGGLATGLKSIYSQYDCSWIGWNGLASDNLVMNERMEIKQQLLEKYKCHTTFLSRQDIRLFYHGFCNDTIWPLFHYFPEHTVYDQKLWNAYKRVNEIYCETVLEVARPGDTIWIHDYQLLPLPQLIRQNIEDVNIGFFLHIPFPSYEIFRQLPWRRTILQGMLGADLVGFHTYGYVRHFLSSVWRLLGHEHSSGLLKVDTRVVKADVFPMGIDYERFAGAVETPGVQKEIASYRKQLHDRKIIVSVDRLDYSKGIIERLKAFDLFLTENPRYREKVNLIVLAVPSRTGVKTYQDLKQQIDEQVGSINGKHGAIGWTPIWYLFRTLPFEKLAALYAIGDIALVTPLRDGMNLVAKEYVAAKSDSAGILILSEMAGAAKELGEAFIINPNNVISIKDAIRQAFEMPEEEADARFAIMQNRLKRYTVHRWAKDFVDRLQEVRNIQKGLYSRLISPKVRNSIRESYRSSKKRLLLLDYDGTLIPFADLPQKATPDKKLIGILKKLTHDKKNDVVIISGRDRNSLERFFGLLDLDLVAVHGGWQKMRDGEWVAPEHQNTAWKDEFRSLMEFFVDRTPGSMLEEKEFSLVFHYRKSDPELAAERIRELNEVLRDLTTHRGLEVLEGSRVVEVKNTGISKGRAAKRWLARDKYDFILAIGDDWTDEDTFSVLPDSAFSIKVGLGMSQAVYSLHSVQDVRELLIELTGRKNE